MKTQTLFYLWIAIWFSLEVIGAPILVYINFWVGLLFMILGLAIVLIPYIVYFDDWERKKVNAYFSKRQNKKEGKA